MAELALGTLLARSCLVERTKDCLRIDTERDLLHLHGLEQLSLLLLSLLFVRLGFGPECLFLLLLERRTRLARYGLLLLDASDFSFDFCRFVFLLSGRNTKASC